MMTNLKSLTTEERYAKIGEIIDNIERDIDSSAVLEEAITKILETVTRAARAEAGTLWFYHRFKDGRITPMSVYGDVALNDIYLLPGEGIAGKVIESGESLLISDCQNDTRWTKKVDAETGFVTHSMLCVPLRIKDFVFGSIQILNKQDGNAFVEDDLQFMEDLSDKVSMLLEEHALLEDYHSDARESRYADEKYARRVILNKISTYMDPEIMHEILRNDGKHKKSLHTEDIVVFFADIRGYTSLA